MTVVILIGILYMIFGIFVYAYCESKFDELNDKKLDCIISCYLWGMVFYYIFLICLVFGD